MERTLIAISPPFLQKNSQIWLFTDREGVKYLSLRQFMEATGMSSQKIKSYIAESDILSRSGFSDVYKIIKFTAAKFVLSATKWSKDDLRKAIEMLDNPTFVEADEANLKRQKTVEVFRHQHSLDDLAEFAANNEAPRFDVDALKAGISEQVTKNVEEYCNSLRDYVMDVMKQRLAEHKTKVEAEVRTALLQEQKVNSTLNPTVARIFNFEI